MKDVASVPPRSEMMPVAIRRIWPTARFPLPSSGHASIMSLLTILLIVLIVAVLFGGFGYSRRGR